MSTSEVVPDGGAPSGLAFADPRRTGLLRIEGDRDAVQAVAALFSHVNVG